MDTCDVALPTGIEFMFEIVKNERLEIILTSICEIHRAKAF